MWVMGVVSHCPIGMRRCGAASSSLVKHVCLGALLKAQEQSNWNTTALPYVWVTLSMVASIDLFMSSMADFLPIANSLSPTSSLTCFSHLIIVDRANLLRVAPTVMGLILPFVPFRRGATLIVLRSLAVSLVILFPRMWFRVLVRVLMASLSPMRV